MHQTLHASHNDNLYRVQLHGLGDVADLVRDHRLETLTSSDGAIAFWFSPFIQSSRRQINKLATELLLTATRFTARQVPPLRGNIVITGNDAHGSLTGLTDEQMDVLINTEPTNHDQWVLARRFARDRRAKQRESRSTAATRTAAILRPWR